MVATRSGPKIWRMAFVNVVFPDPLSPAIPITKTSGDRPMISLKWGIRGMLTVPAMPSVLRARVEKFPIRAGIP